MKKRVTNAEYETLAAFRHALRRFLHFSEEAARNVGLTPPQHQALLALKGFGGPDHVAIKDLAERLQLRHNSVVGLVDRLAALGLVVRKAELADRRRVGVAITPAGADVLEQLTSAHKDELRRIAPQLRLLLALVGEEGGNPANSSPVRPRKRKR